jgi:dTDP-4-amino-4,6-dideoxygalactose transaminase
MIPLFWPQIYKEEWLNALSNVFNTRWLGQGPVVEEFEKQFSTKFNYDYCVSVNSGTSALTLAYHLLDIKNDDEVLTTVLTCTATNIPLLHRKAKIKFVDINDKLTMDYYSLEQSISDKTKAIVVVTLGGMPIDTRIFDIAKLYKIPVVVDAAQSLGVTEQYGDYICYSFQAIKNFTSGDGGMLILRNEDEYKRAKKLRWFGIDREEKRQADWRCLVNHQMAFDIEEPGYKFHMNDIAAALCIVGLKHVDEILEQRKRICDAYYNELKDHVTCIYGGAYWLFAILVDNRNNIANILTEAGIECDLVHLRNDVFKVFSAYRENLLNMNRVENKYLYLPLNCKVSIDDVQYITRLIKENLI